MKLFLPIVIIVCTYLNCYSQNYTPLIHQGATWINYCSEEYPDTEYRAYKIEGDSIISSTNYAKVFRYDLMPNGNDGFNYSNKAFYGLLRENIVDRKVYALVEVDNWEGIQINECNSFDNNGILKEFLLYDFNLTEGDSMHNCQLDPLEQNSIIVKDTLENIYGSMRRTLFNENGLKLIEGIGYDDGLFMIAHTWIHSGWGYGLLDYCFDSHVNCNFLTSTSETITDVELTIYPNPAQNFLNIESNKDISSLKILNVLGTTVFESQDFNKAQSIYLDLNTGYYNLILMLENNKRLTKKLIITKS